MTGESIRVFIADDHAMVREGLASLVGGPDGDIEIVGQCGDGLRVVPEVLAVRPDVVVLDISLPGLNGLDLCRELGRKAPDAAVLVLTMHNNEQFVARALANGATGYLLKEAAAEQLDEAIRRVAAGEIFLGPGIGRGVLDRLGRDRGDLYDLLSTREKQVLQLIAEGETNRRIGEILGLATKTIDTHRTRLMQKLDIHNRTALVKYAIARGIISVPGEA
jgi:two-component system response regulator NreC